MVDSLGLARPTLEGVAVVDRLPAKAPHLIAESIPAIVYGVMALRLPESPRYLVAKGDYDIHWLEKWAARQS